MFDPATCAYHDANYGYMYDGSQGCLVDLETGKRYSMSYEPMD